MKLSNLSSFETLNTQSLNIISGGLSAVVESSRNDSETKDCKKHDTFN